MRTRLILVLAALACVSMSAQSQEKPKSPAGPSGVKVERDILYVPGGDPSQALDLYIPDAASAKPRPLIIWVHGGGWKGGSKSGGPFVYLLSEGYAVASVEYRFSTKAVFPAQIQDCQAAVRWLRANAVKYNFDPEKFAAWGGSAGGHLVALMGTSGGKKIFPAIGGNEEQSDRVQAVCDLYGPKDFTTVVAQAGADKAVKFMYTFQGPKDPYWNLIQASVAPDEPKAKAVSPITYVSKDCPPMLILHGTVDAQVPFAQSTQFAEAYEKAGASVLLQKLPGSGHGGPAFNLPAVKTLTKNFFDKHLKGADVKVEVLPDSAVTVGGK